GRFSAHLLSFYLNEVTERNVDGHILSRLRRARVDLTSNRGRCVDHRRRYRWWISKIIVCDASSGPRSGSSYCPSRSGFRHFYIQSQSTVKEYILSSLTKLLSVCDHTWTRWNESRHC